MAGVCLEYLRFDRGRGYLNASHHVHSFDGADQVVMTNRCGVHVINGADGDPSQRSRADGCTTDTGPPHQCAPHYATTTAGLALTARLAYI